MYIGREYRDWPAKLKGGIVAIGNFDGLHRGHQLIIEQLVQAAKEQQKPAIILSFEPHPRRLFQPDAPELRLLPFHRKAAMLRAMGVDGLLAQRFNRKFSQLDAQAFIEQVLVNGLAANRVITGEDFVFGHQRSGNAAILADYAEKTSAFTYQPIAPLGNEGEGKFSSSKIREHLRQGEMELASRMLGRPYDWEGRVITGDQRGRTIGFPTANIKAPPILLPRYGEYAMRGEWNGALHHGVANFGVRPTYQVPKPQLEVHWFGVDEDLYGKTIRIEWLKHLRDEKRFDGLDALKAQIEKDKHLAQEFFAS